MEKSLTVCHTRAFQDYCCHRSRDRVGNQPTPHQAAAPTTVPRVCSVPYRRGGAYGGGVLSVNSRLSHYTVCVGVVWRRQFHRFFGPRGESFGAQL